MAVLTALELTGALSARIGGANTRRAVFRVLIGGASALGNPASAWAVAYTQSARPPPTPRSRG